MATYLIAKEITITRKEGDKSDVVFTVPEIIDLADKTVRFGIFRQDGSEVHVPLPENIAKSGQVITIDFPADAFLGQEGTHVWELEVSANDSPITIGKGDFKILKEWLKTS